MTSQLQVRYGHYSDKGRKAHNQDFHDGKLPQGNERTLKGLAFAIADGISSSDVSRQAAETAVGNFLSDYYCTPESWSVKQSANKVISAANAWLHSQTLQSPFRNDFNRGYVCTLSVLILRQRSGHLFHLGDSRIYRLRNGSMEQLTRDHRVWEHNRKSYLANAMGMRPLADIDEHSVELECGDVFLLTTDGIHDFADPAFIDQTLQLHSDNLDDAARQIAEDALERGSDDNLTLQVIQVTGLPPVRGNSPVAELQQLPLPPALDARMEFDGYRILRNLHTSSRSHVWLAEDLDSGKQVALKVPSGELQQDTDYLDRFLMEEWISRRINSPHVLQPQLPDRPRTYLYTTTEYVDGQTLTQWLEDNPKPSLEVVRGIIEQIARGLRAFHRLEMLHQDLKPGNVLIDHAGTVRIIDFGSTAVRGLMDAGMQTEEPLPGTALYMAPEYFIGLGGSTESDQFSLAVLTYHMLTGQYPYGTRVAHCRSQSAQRRLEYRSILNDEHTEVPAWVDSAIQRACQIDPLKRYDDLAEFVYDLRHPNQQYLKHTRPPLVQRNPVAFWQALAALELLLLLVLCYQMLN